MRLPRNSHKNATQFCFVISGHLLLEPSHRVAKKLEQPMERPMWKGQRPRAESSGWIPSPRATLTSSLCEWAILRVHLPTSGESLWLILNSRATAEQQQSLPSPAQIIDSWAKRWLLFHISHSISWSMVDTETCCLLPQWRPLPNISRHLSTISSFRATESLFPKRLDFLGQHTSTECLIRKYRLGHFNYKSNSSDEPDSAELLLRLAEALAGSVIWLLSA